MTRRLRDAAVRDNATWCDIVCTANDLATHWGDRVWSVAQRAPGGYPDAVTLTRGVAPSEILDRVDARPGCAVKDSFADLDLAPHGFGVLFDASWICLPPPDARPPTVSDQMGWALVQDRAMLRQWTAVHGMVDAFRPALLGLHDVRIIGRRAGQAFAAGAVVLGHPQVVGLSNVFCATGDPVAWYAQAAAAAQSLFPDRPLIGYEGGEDLDHALAAGFEEIGALRVWLKP